MRKGGSAAEALRESVRLAQIIERLGYERYWVAEHHNTGSFAGTSPEMLIGPIATATKSIRVGSAGVMLTHYSALKVAEQFRILDAFHPGRIDLGIGRAPGSDQLTAAALAYPRAPMDVRRFPQQVADLVNFLHGTMGEDHPFARVKVQPGPVPVTAPEVWLLGSSDYSAQVAAAFGLPFAFADFFGYSDIGPEIAELYRQEFKPSKLLNEPKVNVTVHVICAPTEAEAKRIATSRNVNRVAHVYGLQGLLPPEEATAFALSDEAREYVARYARNGIDGDPDQVRARILETAERYGTNDVGIVTNCFRFEDRVRSYELVAQVFGLTPRWE